MPTSPAEAHTPPVSPSGVLRALHTPKHHKKPPQSPLNVTLPVTEPTTPPAYAPVPGEPTLTPPPRSPGAPPAGDARNLVDGTSSDKSSETAVGGISRTPSTAGALSRKESYKAQRQNYRREKKRAATALLHSIEDPSVVVLADWLKVRGSLKSWTKLWCVLKPGLLLLYKSPKAKSSHWVGTVLLTSCQVIERPSKKDGFCFKLYHPLEQSIWAPRGPSNETIGAVVQPLPTAHLIFRAPSQAAGHCWLDGLELALRCSNAMLRCSRSARRPEPADEPTAISHEELEKHFNEHELAGAASDSELSDTMAEADKSSELTVEGAISRIEERYCEDPKCGDIGQAGEVVEEINEENKSLLWFLMKQVRPGMDLSKVVLPTFILEPRSFLDKLSDSYFHADILATAKTVEDPYERFKIVTRWFLSGLYRKPKGLKKPYNPVLGETFRCCWRTARRDDIIYYVAEQRSKTVTRWFLSGLYRKPKGLKKPYNPVLGETFRCCWRTARRDDIIYYVAEQVSHHPPVSAFYVSNRKNDFICEGSLLARSKFYGNSTSAILEGCARVHLLNWGETYVTTAPYAHCKGIVIGTLSMEYGGKVHIICEQTGYQADIEFKLRSFLSGPDMTNYISGRIKKGKDTLATLEGYWDGRVDIKDKRTGEEQVFQDVTVLKEQRLPRYLVRMEQQGEFESAKLWVKVSEAIERDDQVAATEEKTVIEDGQRARAKSPTAWTPKYFHREDGAKAPDGIIDQGWRYNHSNVNPWQPEEKFEYEEDFIIQSIWSGLDTAHGQLGLVGPRPGAHTHPPRASDTDDGREGLAPRAKRATKALKHSLQAIESALREQSLAIERLARQVQNVADRQGQIRSQNMGRIQSAAHSWDILVGFVLAVVLQALLNWMFYQKD